MGRTARGRLGDRRATFLYAFVILACGAALSRYGLGNLWQPPAGSPFAAPTQSQLQAAVTRKLPGADILAFRHLGQTSIAVASKGDLYSIWEARLGVTGTGSDVVLSGQSAQSTQGQPVSVTQVLNSPAVLVAYVNDETLARQAASAAIDWSDGSTSRIFLAERPRAWIVPPPSPATSQPQWQRIVLYDRFARPIAVVTASGTRWIGPGTTLAPGAFAMPRTTAF